MKLFLVYSCLSHVVFSDVNKALMELNEQNLLIFVLETRTKEF